MKQRLKNQSGTTLVELIVCMVLLSLFTLAAVTLIQPSAQAYMDIQQQTRAQIWPTRSLRRSAARCSRRTAISASQTVQQSPMILMKITDMTAYLKKKQG